MKLEQEVRELQRVCGEFADLANSSSDVFNARISSAVVAVNHQQRRTTYLEKRVKELEEKDMFREADPAPVLRLAQMEGRIAELEKAQGDDVGARAKDNTQETDQNILVRLGQMECRMMEMVNRIKRLEEREVDLDNRLRRTAGKSDDVRVWSVSADKRIEALENHGIEDLSGRMAALEQSIDNLAASHNALLKNMDDRLEFLELKHNGKPVPGCDPEKHEEAK